jgi:hypothetical protein
MTKFMSSPGTSRVFVSIQLTSACLAALSLCLLTSSAMAHHSTSAYSSEIQTLSGVVRSYEWANPHIFIYVDVEDPDEGTVIWTVEGGFTSNLVEYGLSPDFLQPGDSVFFSGRFSRNLDRREMLGYLVSKDGGPTRRMTNHPVRDLEYDLPRSDPLPDDRAVLPVAEALIGTWLPLNPTQSPLTAQQPFLSASSSRQAEVESLPDSNSLRAQCVPFSPPFNMTMEGVKGIEMRSANIVIRDASVGDVERVVRMNASTHGESDPDSMQGDSIGYWDGDILVVETVFNNGEIGVIVRDVPFSGVSRMEERFELSQDRSMLKYIYSVESPEYLKLPATGSVDWGFRPDLEVPRLPCDPENARRFLESQ